MSPTTTAPDPTGTAGVDVVPDDVAEREALRLEFEAIITAGYRSGADEPRPAPPRRRVAVMTGRRRPVVRPAVPTGAARPGRLRPAPPAGPAPRERGPPAPRPAR
jgi:hypothetical protein